MLLDERSAILIRLLQRSTHLKMNELIAQTGLTRRQLQYGIGKTNDWLESHGYRPIVYDQNAGYYLQDQVAVDSLDIKLTKRTYVFSEEDRQTVFYLILLLSQELLSVYHFQSISGVSRNTVIKDLQRLKEVAQKSGLKIKYSKQIGYVIEGDSNQKRYVVEQLIRDVLNSGNVSLITQCVWREHEERMHDIQKQLMMFERQSGITFSDERLQELVYLFLSTDHLIARGETIHSIDHWEQLTSTKEYRFVEEMTQSNTFIAEWSQSEKLYATVHLMSMNRTKDASPLQESNEDLRDLLKKVVQEFERLAFVHMHDKEQFYDQLFVHFKPAYYRLKYRVTLINNMTKRIQRVYPELYHVTKKSLSPIENVIGYPVSDDEIAYFTIHFGGWLRKQGTTLDERKRAIVVCPNGIGISNILVYTLRELFPDILFLDVLSVRDAADYPLSYDLVFSTVHLRTEALLFVVPPILEVQDKHKLRQHVMQRLYGYTLQNLDVNSLIELIGQYTTIHNQSDLEKAIQTHMYTFAQKNTKLQFGEEEKPVLEELLTTQTIQLAAKVTDWKEGIRTASKPLLELGTIEESYVESMIESIEANGPYVVITPGVAIPHARPEEGVRSLSMSLLKLDEAVEFAPGKPVRLIIVLAAADSESHLRALVQLTTLLGDPANIEDILQSKDKSVLLNYIQKYSKEETK
ncbi:BglG family transcription antiterminator [Fictibacillus phosphorivorans]|uniref:BglG family transcription antiterminator n=1 Tax=Fictibacillus phosphorivorans TaxID=1221500 RepID=UPI00204248DC|nr:BglG family transcription antiterminator [Fictibacillus phosphorivorans]MCM3718315.1 BglG family transcription antiterminator [Fictibacillus phosphorivorans]MCM3775821.1 BglG family transcription antiterminator [Fictibacillus phosphorivorans]